LKTLFVTLPPSGIVVTVSLALDQAPFTKMTPVGTFVSGSVTVEKSPPLLGELGGCVFWPETNDDAKQMMPIRKHENRECMVPPWA
jgi:hypothetical protein